MPPHSGETGAIDHDILDDILSYLDRSDRFRGVEAEPEDDPDSITCRYDLGFFPASVEEVYLQITWYETGDFNIHYRELYHDGATWECRWDRHPNDHNTREHYHPGPDATRAAARDASFPQDWRDVLERVLREIDARMRSFWE